ncbi:MAG: M20/M25/M40 family metallo-hydrolase [bacterium]|nr:M20/M25/M40 family metallo-hydrolase [Gammaproteobacteria bacterium]HIL96866.1 M20/M25/M40 family metallo-hydrolase [Pseudomonadales bacterium]
MRHKAFQATFLVLLLSASLNIDASEFADQAAERLSEYIQINTENPPGNETRGVEFFARIFDEAGIEYETAESAPGRGNIWARLKGGNEPALILLNHMDVVPADLKYWTSDPYSGEIRDGHVYGRGALDMKGSGIVQLQAFLSLHAVGSRLNRDVIFMATADEEAGGAFGAGWLAENRPELFQNVGYLINEGGGGSVIGEQTVFRVELTQKVPLWLRLVAHGNPGHGSSPQTETAVTRIIRAGDRVARTKFPARVIPSVQALFESTARYEKEPLAAQFADIENSVKSAEFMNLLQLIDPRSHSLLRNTCSLTRLKGSNKINVVPTEASIELDCRLLPDQDPDQFLEELSLIINDTNVDIEKIMGFTPAVSSADTPFYRLIEQVYERNFPGAHVIPGVSTGFTDSHFFRDMGITSYGYGAFVVPRTDSRGVHGNNERISVENMRRGTEVMIDLLESFTD